MITLGGGHTGGHFLSGDFTGNGIQDIAFAFNDGGKISIDVYQKNPNFNSNVSTFRRWVTKSGGYPEGKWVSGDFNQDGRDDIALIFNNKGTATIQTYNSKGGSFEGMRWIKSNAGTYDRDDIWLAGDFNGDTRDDIMRVHSDGTVADFFLLSGRSGGGVNNPILFQNNQGGKWNGQKWFSGDFNGDGITDITKVWWDNRNMSSDVHLGSPNGLIKQRWATRQGGYSDSQHWFVSDFDGDGFDDLGKVFALSGDSVAIDMHYSRNGEFEIDRIGTHVGPSPRTAAYLGGNFLYENKGSIVNIFELNNRFAIGAYY